MLSGCAQQGAATARVRQVEKTKKGGPSLLGGQGPGEFEDAG